MVALILITVALLLIWSLIVWPALTNPFGRWSIVKRPFTTRLAANGQIELKQHFSLKVRQGTFYNALGIIKSGVHEIMNAFVGSPKAHADHEEAIINKIHELRFNPKYPFLISGDHFVMLYPRSLGIFYQTLLDPRTARSKKDWYNRQAIYLQTLAYALDVFQQTKGLATTIAPIWRRSVILTNVFNPPADTLYSLLYAFSVLSDESELRRLYPLIPKSMFHLQTKQATAALLEQYAPTLARHLKQFTKDVYDPRTGLVRKNIQLSGTKDISIEHCGFYENVVFWRTHQLAMQLGLIPEDKVFLAAFKARIIKSFWVADEGHFLEDLSKEGKKRSYYSSDWLIVLMTGFLNPRDKREQDYYLRSVRYIQREKIDQPFGLKYQQENRAFREHFFDHYFVRDYGGTAIWSHWGMEYVKLLALLAHDTKNLSFIHRAVKQLDAYKQKIEQYKGYPELYHQNGKLFIHTFYKSVRQTGWVVNYEQAGELVSAVQAKAGETQWKQRRINLILGPGAARGFMHVGAIRALVEDGYQIESIMGNSSGAFIALLYAKFQDIDKVERLIRAVPFRGFLKHDHKNILSINHDAITNYFVKIFGKKDLRFDELDMPLAFFATNLVTGKPDYLYQGEILPALMASATLPLINAPQYINGTPYIDGGLIYNMPDKIPAALENQHPYVGINVAYEKKLRRGEVRYARRSLIAALSYLYGRKYRQLTVPHAAAREQYNDVVLYQIVMNDRLIRPTDFHKVRQSIGIGYRAAVDQALTLFAATPIIAPEPVKPH